MQASDIVSIISLIFAGLGIYLSWSRTRVIGPKFVIPYVELDNAWERKEDGSPYCSIIPLIQNFGDRMSYLVIKEINLFVHTNNKIYASEKTEELPYRQPFQAQTQSTKRFIVYLPKKAEFWNYGFLEISGDYTDHKGNLKPLYFTYDLFPGTRTKYFFLGRQYIYLEHSKRKPHITNVKRSRNPMLQKTVKKEIHPLSKDELKYVKKKINEFRQKHKV